MTREEFINYLMEIGVPFRDASKDIPGGGHYDGVYIFEKKAYELKHKHPRKYKGLYVPYLRVSNFDGDWYIREDGWTQYCSESIVLEKVKELAS